MRSHFFLTNFSFMLLFCPKHKHKLHHWSWKQLSKLNVKIKCQSRKARHFISFLTSISVNLFKWKCFDACEDEGRLLYEYEMIFCMLLWYFIGLWWIPFPWHDIQEIRNRFHWSFPAFGRLFFINVHVSGKMRTEEKVCVLENLNKFFPRYLRL